MDIENSPQKQKALAFALLLKEKTNQSSVVNDFSIYKVQKMTGLAYKTIRKYLDVLKKLGLCVFDGGKLFIKKMTSSSKHRNIDISRFKIDKAKNVYHQIRDLLFLVIQAHKDFIKSLLRLRTNPTHDVDFKKVRRLSKKCCNDPYAEYKELGLSYNYIAKRLGCCVRTAMNIVKDSVGRRWCKKYNHCTYDLMVGVNYRYVPGYTFTSRNYGYILRPNTYELSPSWSRALASRAFAPRAL